MRNAAAPSYYRADEHRDADRQTDQVSDSDKSERQKEIISTNCSALPNPKSLRHIASQYLRLNDDREYRRDDRSPQHREQTGTSMFNVSGVLRASAASYFQDFGASNTFWVRK